uniref:RNA-directed RNA polymerase n=1 Tax=Steinernema glaseri TaxID=37863 RepID=A0A1I7YTQ5_9BILA
MTIRPKLLILNAPIDPKNGSMLRMVKQRLWLYAFKCSKRKCALRAFTLFNVGQFDCQYGPNSFSSHSEAAASLQLLVGAPDADLDRVEEGGAGGVGADVGLDDAGDALDLAHVVAGQRAVHDARVVALGEVGAPVGRLDAHVAVQVGGRGVVEDGP